ncbi:MAG: PD-(D/E)XK nuclease family protein [Eubacterium sp.]|nr:PD-(D/E)XK nuclease family protein [Eubacterium sp.]
MLTLLLGASGTGKTREIYKRICKAEGKTLFFVPDQFMFEAEKIISERLGEKTQDIKVTGFSALSEKILRKYRPRKSYADNTAKLIIMMKAVRELKGSLRYYGDAAGKARFPSLMLDAVNMLKSGGITPDTLAAAIPDSSFADKLTDICTVYALYDRMLNEIYDDRQDNLLLAAEAARENGCFEEYDVYIDGFDSFSGSQLKFLQPLTVMSKSCTAALTVDRYDKKGCFLPVTQTKRALERFATENFTEIKEEWFEDASRYNSPAIAALQGGLFSGEKADAELSDDELAAVTLAAAPDTEAEADYVCSSIKKLMRDGYKCSEIAVLCPAPQKYLETVKSAFLRYDIPLFADIPEPISEKPLIKYIDALLAAADDPCGENMLRYIKSGFVRIAAEGGKTRPITLREISDIEEFSNRWGLDKRSWTRPFLKCETPAEQRSESIRAFLAKQLVKLRRACDNADGRKMTEELTRFLFEEADISAAIQGKCQDYTTRDLRYNKAMTEEYNSLWDMTSKLLNSAWETTEGVELSLREYSAILKACAAQITMSLPPQVLDSVIFGDPARTRTAGARAVFVMGAEDGVLPDYGDKNNGVFTASENAELSRLNINIAPDEETTYSSALLTVYKALTLPKERLTVTHIGKPEDDCEVFSFIQDIIGITEIADISTLPTEFFCESREAARARLARTRLTDLSDSLTVEQALKMNGDDEFPKLVRRAEDGMSDNSYLHDTGAAARLLFRKELLSPTGIELLNSCRFAYFLRYGLKLREPQTNTMNPRSFGDTVHYVMKHCFDVIHSGEKPPADYTDEEIKDIVDGAMDLFLEENFLPEEETGRRFTVIYCSIAPLCRMLITYMRDELENSGFTPTYFELSLSDGKTMEDGFKAEPFKLDIPLADGETRTVKIRGTVDRVDVANADDGKHWLRVIDYKTGRKDISVGRVYYGLDLQLLLYLFTLCENNRGYLPSSATYYPAGDTPLRELEEAPDDKMKRSFWLDDHRERGFAVTGSLSEQERDRFDGYTIAKSGEIKPKNYYSASDITEQALEELKQRITGVISENVALVTDGDVSAVPVTEKGKPVSCEYCEYYDICGRKPDIAANDASGAAAEEFKEKINGKGAAQDA